jgi:hypothetical protein
VLLLFSGRGGVKRRGEVLKDFNKWECVEAEAREERFRREDVVL